MTENRENWLYPNASGLYFQHDGFVMRATDGKQYYIEEECELLNELSYENIQLTQFKNLARDYNIPFNKLIDTFEDVLNSDTVTTLETEVAKLKEENEMLDYIIESKVDDKTVELSVHYDNCDHIQPLGEVYVADSEIIDWITLRGGKI